jgi:hypothetical protein
LGWEKHDQHNEYVVYTLSAASGEEADVQAAIGESVAQMCRIAEGNITPGIEVVLFEWDAVYSTLTVVFTTLGRNRDAREVLKVFVPAWRADTAELSEDDQLEIWEEREDLMRAWVRRALRPPQIQACLATLASRGVAPAFTAQHHATEFEPL